MFFSLPYPVIPGYKLTSPFSSFSLSLTSSQIQTLKKERKNKGQTLEQITSRQNIEQLPLTPHSSMAKTKSVKITNIVKTKESSQNF